MKMTTAKWTFDVLSLQSGDYRYFFNGYSPESGIDSLTSSNMYKTTASAKSAIKRFCKVNDITDYEVEK